MRWSYSNLPSSGTERRIRTKFALFPKRVKNSLGFTGTTVVVWLELYHSHQQLIFTNDYPYNPRPHWVEFDSYSIG